MGNVISRYILWGGVINNESYCWYPGGPGNGAQTYELEPPIDTLLDFTAIARVTADPWANKNKYKNKQVHSFFNQNNNDNGGEGSENVMEIMYINSGLEPRRELLQKAKDLLMREAKIETLRRAEVTP